jgi:hypothetical protein
MNFLALVFAFIGAIGINLFLLERAYRAGRREAPVRVHGLRIGEGAYRSSGERVCPTCGHVIEQKKES